MRQGRVSAPRGSAHLKRVEDGERKIEEDRAYHCALFHKLRSIRSPRHWVCGNYRVILTVAINNFSRIHETVDGKAFRNALGDIHFTAGRNVNTFLSKGEISLNLGVL